MIHPLFGPLRRDEDEGTWTGEHRLPVLAQYDVYYGDRALADLEAEEPAGAEESPGVVGKALDKLQNKVADWIGKDLSEYEDFDDEDDDPAAAAEEAAERQRFRQGIFPVIIEASSGAGPSAEQERAFQELVANEAAVVGVAMKAIFDDYCRSRVADPAWFKIYPPIQTTGALKRMLRCTGIRVSEYHRHGLAYVGFLFHCLWDEEHGLGVLFHKDRVIAVGDHESASNVAEADNWPAATPATPHQALLQAVYAGDTVRIAQLRAEGTDINAFEKDEYPPLHLAVQQLDAKLVKTLLDLGADPRVKFEGKTALECAEEQAKTMSLGQKSVLMRFALRLAQFFNPGPFKEFRRKTEEIVALLRQAGG